MSGVTVLEGGGREWRPHPAQAAILQDTSRFRVAVCGRRFGKTELGSVIALDWARTSTPRRPVWWVAPTYDLCHPGIEACQDIYPEEWVRSVTTAPGNMAIRFKWGGSIEFKSAEKERTLRGRGLRGLLCEEAGEMRDQAWHAGLRPTLADSQAPAFIFGTPKGRNWFHAIATRGLAGEPGYRTFVYETAVNPLIAPEEIEEARRTTPTRAFRQEWLAEFITDAGGVFHEPRRLAQGDEEACDGTPHVIGWDPAKHQDWSAVSVDRVRDRRTVRFLRMQKVPYDQQVQRVAAIAREFNAPVVLDVGGPGDPVHDLLVRAGVEVWPYRFTHASKQNLINNLSVLVAEGSTAWPDIPVLTNELEVYEWKDGGRSGAPDGFHDDCVMAKALAEWGISHGGGRLVARAEDDGESLVKYL